MRQKPGTKQSHGEKVVNDIRRAARKQYSAEEKIRIVLDGLKGEDSIAELCRREGIAQGLYYSWSKEFLEAGKKRLAGDTAREAKSKLSAALITATSSGNLSFLNSSSLPMQDDLAWGWACFRIIQAHTERSGRPPTNRTPLCASCSIRRGGGTAAN